MKKISLLLVLFVLASCNSSEPDLLVKGTIKGLKKGRLYLQKLQDTKLINVDSVNISGNAQFELSSNLEEPEMFYLYLDKNDTDEARIKFFANKGITEINTSLKHFVLDAKIKGSKQQDILQEYNTMSAKYRSKNLDLLKENFEALRDSDSVKVNETETTYKHMLKSKYLYTINFAINNKTSQVAPYLALTEVYDAQLKYLDTIYGSLPDSIASSKYGKALNAFIKERKIIEEKP